MLDTIDNPIAPRLAEHADSPAMRQLAGGEYEALTGAGLQPNQRLVKVLKAWRDEGLPGVRRLVDQGLAPAVAPTVLSQLPSGQSQPLDDRS